MDILDAFAHQGFFVPCQISDMTELAYAELAVYCDLLPETEDDPHKQKRLGIEQQLDTSIASMHPSNWDRYLETLWTYYFSERMPLMTRKVLRTIAYQIDNNSAQGFISPSPGDVAHCLAEIILLMSDIYEEDIKEAISPKLKKGLIEINVVDDLVGEYCYLQVMDKAGENISMMIS